MSALTKAIEAERTGRVKFSPAVPGVILVKEDIARIDSIEHTACIQYKLTAQFSAHGYATDPKDLKHLTAGAQRQIIEAVFGEFRPAFREIEMAMFDLDVDKARRLLRELELEMYT